MALGDGQHPFSTVGIVGLSLIGGSVAARVRRAWPEGRLLDGESLNVETLMRIFEDANGHRQRVLDAAPGASVFSNAR